MAKKSVIPVHSMENLKERGIMVMPFQIGDLENTVLNSAHRDEHFIFAFQQEGESGIMIDFKEVWFDGRAISYIMPGQVHHGIFVKNTKGWFIALDAAFMAESDKAFFEQRICQPALLRISDAMSTVLENTISLLYEVLGQGEENLFPEKVIRSLSDTLTGMFATLYARETARADLREKRPAVITREFRRLLFLNYKTLKSPAGYAGALNISTPYLNEAVKQTTGFPVSYWIHQEIMMEARRMLYYTDQTVKEIAFALGYEDHAYFSRLFSKTVQMSPLAFRAGIKG
ncbi:helix-turn-helix domain-containing protein [Dyadobacter bucti]|uniref:AraC family transcriptional regulator n=1 Tax=Dyadobacter bucti TaxID=2572203 RepID=UPI003F726963